MRAPRARRSRGFTLAEQVVVIGLTTVLLVAIAPAIDALVRHQGLATDYAEDLAQGTRVADRIAREIRGSRVRLRATPRSQRPAGEGELLLLTRTGYERLSVSPGRRVLLERFGGDESLVGREDLGRAAKLAFSKPSPVSSLVSFDVEFPRRTEGARPAVLSSAALLGGEAGP